MSSKIALITGGNRGIGFAVCKSLKDQGHTVILTSRNIKEGKAAAKQLGVEFCQLDITKEPSRIQCKKFIEKKFNRLDILINNAGVYFDNPDPNVYEAPAFETTISNLKKTLEVNTIAPFRLCQLFIPLMQKYNYGRIVNVSSIYGQLSSMQEGDPAYRISKTALNAVTKIFAAETKGNNILINSVHPGWVKTRMGGSNADLTPEQGADTIIWAATLPDNGPSGKFFYQRKEIEW
jgi:NAD(P)-dependent dehydrogenase (short-subunit alcohol dehydrogenase family)